MLRDERVSHMQDIFHYIMGDIIFWHEANSLHHVLKRTLEADGLQMYDMGLMICRAQLIGFTYRVEQLCCSILDAILPKGYETVGGYDHNSDDIFIPFKKHELLILSENLIPFRDKEFKEEFCKDILLNLLKNKESSFTRSHFGERVKKELPDFFEVIDHITIENKLREVIVELPEIFSNFKLRFESKKYMEIVKLNNIVNKTNEYGLF